MCFSWLLKELKCLLFCFNLSTKCFNISRYVDFLENNFPYSLLDQNLSRLTLDNVQKWSHPVTHTPLFSIMPFNLSQPLHADSSSSLIRKPPRSFSPLTVGSQVPSSPTLLCLPHHHQILLILPNHKHVCIPIHRLLLIPLMMFLFVKSPSPLNFSHTSFIKVFHKRYVILLLLVLTPWLHDLKIIFSNLKTFFFLLFLHPIL